jgi:hypothetical protein
MPKRKETKEKGTPTSERSAGLGRLGFQDTSVMPFRFAMTGVKLLCFVVFCCRFECFYRPDMDKCGRLWTDVDAFYFFNFCPYAAPDY